MFPMDKHEAFPQRWLSKQTLVESPSSFLCMIIYTNTSEYLCTTFVQNTAKCSFGRPRLWCPDIKIWASITYFYLRIGNKSNIADSGLPVVRFVRSERQRSNVVYM